TAAVWWVVARQRSIRTRPPRTCIAGCSVAVTTSPTRVTSLSTIATVGRSGSGEVRVTVPGSRALTVTRCSCSSRTVSGYSPGATLTTVSGPADATASEIVANAPG